LRGRTVRWQREKKKNGGGGREEKRKGKGINYALCPIKQNHQLPSLPNDENSLARGGKKKG